MKWVTLATITTALAFFCYGSTATSQDTPRKADDSNRTPPVKVKEDLRKELAKLQGTWELKRKVGDKTVRSVKEIKGNKSRITRYDPQGKVYWSHTSEFELSVSGRVRLFTFFNLQVEAGPNKGARSNKRSSYVYRVHKKTLTEARGLLTDQEDEEPRLAVWRRVEKGKIERSR